MRWTIFLKIQTPSSLCLYRQGPRKLSGVVSRKVSKRFAVPRNMGVLLGLGVMGGASLTLIKYYKSDRTSSCQSQVVTFDPSTSEVAQSSPKTIANMTVQEFGPIQRLFIAVRFMYLCFLFSPAVGLYTLSYLLGSPTLANVGWKYVVYALQGAGPAFMKLGQWASTRRDLFSHEFCSTLSHLHLHCTPHSWKETVKLFEETFGPSWQDVLLVTDHTPIGTGCVAQVYQGRLSDGVKTHADGGDGVHVAMESCDDHVSAGGVPIAVKVLHPDIVRRMARDICLMKYVASWVDLIYPDVHWVALTECVDEFSIIMEKQLDLKLEAKNLSKFKSYMTDYAHVKFPTPIYPYVTDQVLVESFEPGDQIAEYLGNPGGKLQKSLAKIGVEALLDMLFVHNFVHGDLHPGNILVQQPTVNQPKLVLLDCGIATALQPLDLENMHCVFTAVVTGQGWKVADLFLAGQTCATLDEYRREMASVVDAAVSDLNLQKVRVDNLFTNLFNILIEHKVRIDPSFTAVMMAMMLVEGLGRSLDPKLDLLAHARPCLLHRANRSVRENVALRLKKISSAVYT